MTDAHDTFLLDAATSLRRLGFGATGAARSATYETRAT